LLPLSVVGRDTRLGYPDPCRLSTALAAIRAAAAAVGGFPLLAVLVDVADEHPAVYAGVGALGLVVAGRFFGRWVRVGWALGALDLFTAASLVTCLTPLDGPRIDAPEKGWGYSGAPAGKNVVV
jgi:hypothetical protein